MFGVSGTHARPTFAASKGLLLHSRYHGKLGILQLSEHGVGRQKLKLVGLVLQFRDLVTLASLFAMHGDLVERSVLGKCWRKVVQKSPVTDFLAEAVWKIIVGKRSSVNSLEEIKRHPKRQVPREMENNDIYIYIYMIYEEPERVHYESIMSHAHHMHITSHHICCWW